eukprot:766373-Hanusia_phi.AAC.6
MEKQAKLRESATTHLRRLSKSQDFVVYTRPGKTGNSTWKTASAFEAANSNNSSSSSLYQFLPSYTAYSNFMKSRAKGKAYQQTGEMQGRPLSIGMWHAEGFSGPKALKGSQGKRQGRKRGSRWIDCNVTSECEKCSEASLQDNADYCMKTGWMQSAGMEASWAFFLVITWTWMKRRKRLQPGSRSADKSDVQIPMSTYCHSSIFFQSPILHMRASCSAWILLCSIIVVLLRSMQSRLWRWQSICEQHTRRPRFLKGKNQCTLPSPPHSSALQPPELPKFPAHPCQSRLQAAAGGGMAGWLEKARLGGLGSDR